MKRRKLYLKLQCINCQKEFELVPWEHRERLKVNKHSRFFCSMLCRDLYSRTHSRRKLILLNTDQPLVWDILSKTYRKESVTKMEKLIGRRIIGKEIVHHINGNHKDNRIENLLLCKNMSQHKKIEHSFYKLLERLMLDGIVEFDKYKSKYVIVNNSSIVL